MSRLQWISTEEKLELLLICFSAQVTESFVTPPPPLKGQQILFLAVWRRVVTQLKQSGRLIWQVLLITLRNWTCCKTETAHWAFWLLSACQEFQWVSCQCSWFEFSTHFSYVIWQWHHYFITCINLRLTWIFQCVCQLVYAQQIPCTSVALEFNPLCDMLSTKRYQYKVIQDSISCIRALYWKNYHINISSMSSENLIFTHIPDKLRIDFHACSCKYAYSLFQKQEDM